MKCIITISLWLMTCVDLFGQKQIKGRVMDASTREPLIGANIYLLSDFSVGVVTDVEGRFALEVPEQHVEDSLLISFVGYEELILPVTKVSGKIFLNEKEIEMGSVEIRAEPLIAEEFKYIKVDKLEIYTNPASKADPLLAVNSLPASTTVDESAAVSLRGSSPIETGIFLNNVPVYDAIRYSQLKGIGTFSLFNTALVKDVTIYPGNPPLEFGNSTAGVVAITTDDLPVEQNQTSLIISPANLGMMRKQQIGKINLQVFGNYQPSAALKWANPQALEQLDGFQSFDGGIYLYGQIGERFSYKSYHYLLNEQYRYRFEHPTFNGQLEQKRNKSLHVTELNMQLENGMISFNQGLTVGSSDFQYSLSDFDIEDFSLYHGLSYYLSKEQFQLKTGFSWDRRSAGIAGTFYSYSFAIGEEYPVFDLDDEATVSNLEAYVYSKYYLNDQWIVGGGMRKNLNDLTSQNYLSGQLNLTFLPSDSWKVIAGVGQYHKKGFYEQSTEEVFIRSKQASLDLFYNVAGFNASISLFGKAATENDADNRLVGFEAFVDKRFLKDWQMDMAFTYLSPTERSRYDIGYFIKSNIQYSPGYWTFGLNMIHRQGLWYQPIIGREFRSDLLVYEPFLGENDQRYPDYFILNLSASRLFPISEKLTMVAFASVNNLTDHHNVRAYQYNFDYTERSPSLLSRRLIYAGVQVNF